MKSKKNQRERERELTTQAENGEGLEAFFQNLSKV
jgi:hypothetical protein